MSKTKNYRLSKADKNFLAEEFIRTVINPLREAAEKKCGKAREKNQHIEDYVQKMVAKSGVVKIDEAEAKVLRKYEMMPSLSISLKLDESGQFDHYDMNKEVGFNSYQQFRFEHMPFVNRSEQSRLHDDIRSVVMGLSGNAVMKKLSGEYAALHKEYTGDWTKGSEAQYAFEIALKDARTLEQVVTFWPQAENYRSQLMGNVPSHSPDQKTKDLIASAIDEALKLTALPAPKAANSNTRSKKKDAA